MNTHAMSAPQESSFHSLRSAAITLAIAFSVSLSGCAAADGDDEEDEADLEPASSEDALVLRGYDEPSSSDKDEAAETYSHVDPDNVVPNGLLRNALGFYHANKSKLDNTDYVGVIDYSKHSGKKRFFIVNMETGAVSSHVVAHGSGSDPGHTGFAKYFGNTDRSNRTSLGYFVTAETYWMTNHGTALRLDGVTDTNSRARARGIVLHGAGYVRDGRSPQGRSWGCPAVPDSQRTQIINKLKGGALIYSERSTVISG